MLIKYVENSCGPVTNLLQASTIILYLQIAGVHLDGCSDNLIDLLSCIALSALRVYAIKDRDYKLASTVFILSIVPVATSIVRLI